jgi:hypothetical protein
MITQGLWKQKKRTTPGEFVTDHLIVSGRGDVIAVLHCNAEENGRAIAALPHLLNACKMLKDSWEKAAEYQQVDWDSLNMATEAAIDAYNKATGAAVEEDS